MNGRIPSRLAAWVVVKTLTGYITISRNASDYSPWEFVSAHRTRNTAIEVTYNLNHPKETP